MLVSQPFGVVCHLYKSIITHNVYTIYEKFADMSRPFSTIAPGKGVVTANGSSIQTQNAVNGQVLTAKGVDNEPVFEAIPPATNISGGSQGAVVYQSGPSTTAFSNTANGVLVKQSTTPTFSSSVSLSNSGTMLTLTALSDQNSIIINGSNRAIAIRLRNPSSNQNFDVGKDSFSGDGTLSFDNAGTIHTWRFRTNGEFRLPSATYTSAAFLQTNSSGTVTKGTVLPSSAGGTGSTGFVSSTITISRFGGGTLDSVVYVSNNIVHEKVGVFYTLTFYIECTITVSSGSVNLQIDLPITAGSTALENVYDQNSGIVRLGLVGVGAFNKIRLLTSAGVVDSFSSGPYVFTATLKIYSP